jgi:hypothetical protein
MTNVYEHDSELLRLYRLEKQVRDLKTWFNFADRSAHHWMQLEHMLEQMDENLQPPKGALRARTKAKS